MVATPARTPTGAETGYNPPMRILPLLALTVLAGVAVAAPPPGDPLAAPAPPPRSASGRALRIQATERRLESLLANAKKDRAELMVDVFAAYSDLQLTDPKRGVSVEMLLDVVKNDDVAKDVRQRAAETICNSRVATNDPALSMEGRGLKRKRAEFSQKVNKLLLDSDVFVRGLAKGMLETLWGGWAARVKEIRACDPRDRNSCVEANKAWERVFKQ